MAKVYTLDEVAAHNTREDFWITLLGKVYNITTFLDEHPGGDEVLLNTSGKDASQEFDDVGHSHEAWALLEKYYIGDFDRSAIPKKVVSLKTSNTKAKKQMVFLVLQFLIPVVILNVFIFLFSKSSS